MNRLCRVGLMAVVLAPAAGPSGCGTAFSSGPAGADGGLEASGVDAAPPQDGARPGDTSTEAGPPEDARSEAAREAAPPVSIVYVSSVSGLDGNDGTDPSEPKKTIAAALVRAQVIGAKAEVHVCKGVYKETALGLGQSIPLLGSYDCGAWQRTSTYGYPTFDTTNSTILENADPVAQGATLVISGGVTATAVVDGFVIQGATSTSGTTTAVQTLGTASPILQNDVLSGGSGNGGTTAPGSIGLAVIGGSPVLRFSVVDGGSGTGNVGSAAVVVGPSTTPYVHDDVITGGLGTAAASTGLSAVGLDVQASLAGASAMSGLAIAGSGSAGMLGSTVGVLVSGSGIDVDVLSSVIAGGNGASPNTVSAGVEVNDPGGTVNVSGDRIYGGKRTGASSQTYGIYVAQSGPFTVQNVEVHAGTVAAGAGAYSSGINVTAAQSPVVEDSTIYSGAGLGYGIVLAGGLTGVVLTDDLLAGSGAGTASVGVSVATCSGELASLDHTAFVNFENLYGCAAKTVGSVALMAAALPGIPTTGDLNVSSAALCTAATSCVADPSCPGASGTCLSSVFGTSWTSDDGVTGLFDGAPQAGDAMAPLHGWTLLSVAPFLPCALAQGGLAIGGITTDIFEQSRDPTKPTIGAVQYTYAASCR